MKPLKLEIQAFGSYIEKTEIDFTKFGNRGIYLITGDTGSGKTTIFDALVFALYGSPSGDNRNSKMIRSKYLSEEQNKQLTTYAELEFSIRGDIYKIKRTPEYIRPSKRGDGETKQAATSELIMPDGNVVSNNNIVNEMMNEIIGLDRNQFVQIVMLPQGNFMRFLLADTVEKSKIFNKIFDTSQYVKFQNIIKEDVNNVKIDLKNNRGKITTEITHIKCPKDSQFSYEVKRYVEESQNDDSYDYKNVVALIEMVNEDYNSKLKDNKAELKNTEKSLAEITESVLKAENAEKLKKQLYTVNQKILKSSKAIEEYAKKKEISELEYKKYSESEFEIRDIQKKLEMYDELDIIKENQKNLKLNLDVNEKNINSFKMESSTKEAELSLYKKENETIGDTSTKFAELEKEEIVLQNQKNQYTDLSIKFEDYIKTYKSYSKYVNEFEKKRTEFESAKKIADDKYIRFLNEQAGIMASELEENKPCPVCGSVHHPNPATKLQDAPTQDEVNESAKIAEQARNKMEDANKKASELKVKTDTIHEDIEKKLGDLNIEHSSANNMSLYIKNALDDIENKLSEISLNKKVEENKKQKKAHLEKIIPEVEKNIEDLKNQITNLEKDRINLENEYKNKSTELEEKQKNLKYKSKKEAESVVEKYYQEIENLKKNLENIQVKFEAEQKEKNNSEGEKTSLENQIKDIGEYNLDNLIEQQKELTNVKNSIEKINTDLIVNINNNKETHERITKLAKYVENTEKEYQSIISFSEAMNGQLSGQDKITLEVYVQMKFFENIINRANLHFLKFSNSQYELKRGENGLNKRSKTGLDLNIIDHYNNTERNIKSLSGGEMFKASLALALGISDEIQSTSGGVQIETMFIDEGFGSLDEETLGQAMTVLDEISQNCMIGIISHVGELKQRINNKIIVDKDKFDGSLVRIEY